MVLLPSSLFSLKGWSLEGGPHILSLEPNHPLSFDQAPETVSYDDVSSSFTAFFFFLRVSTSSQSPQKAMAPFVSKTSFTDVLSLRPSFTDV